MRRNNFTVKNVTTAIVGRAITLERESHQKRSKELIQKGMQRGLGVISLQGAIDFE